MGPRPGTRYSGPGPPASLLRRQAKQHLAPVGIVVRGRKRVRVLRGGPAGERAGVVLIPGDRLGDRDHRDLLQHRQLQLVHDRLLLRLIGRARVGVDQRVGGRAGVALPVRARRLADRGRVAREQDLPELVVRARPARLAAVAELVLAVVEGGLVGGCRNAVLGDRDADRLEVLDYYVDGVDPVREAAVVDDREGESLPGRVDHDPSDPLWKPAAVRIEIALLGL